MGTERALVVWIAVWLGAGLPLAFALAADASEALGPQTLLVIEPSKEFPRNSEGDLVALRDGSLLLAYTRFTGGGADNSTADICARVSRDGGRAWGPDRVLVKNEGRENIMSVSIVRLAGAEDDARPASGKGKRVGELLLFYLVKNGWNDCNMYVRRSGDEFATLSEPVRVTTAPGYHVVNNARVVQLTDGRLIVPAALHPCPDGTRKTWTGHGVPRAFYSDDGGRTWHGDRTVVDPPPQRKTVLQEPGVVELADGRLWMYMRTNGGSQFGSYSTDRGLTWSEPEPTPLVSPMSPATIARVPWTGDLLAVYNDHSGVHPFPKGRRTPLCVALSRDEGKSWSRSRVIEGDPDGWYCYTAVRFVGDRVILAYCAGDRKVGGLNRLKVTALDRDWLYPKAGE